MGRVPARRNVICPPSLCWPDAGIAAQPNIHQCSVNISELFLAYCALPKQVPHPARYVLREW